MNILEKYNLWNDNLRIEYEKMWPEAKYHIWDGVVSPEDYYKAPIKILFLNKESYDDPRNGGYDISKAISKEYEEGKPILGGGNSTLMMATKSRLSILKWLYKDFCSLDREKTIQYNNIYSIESFRKDVMSVAYCNIKKSDGNKTSNKQDLYINFYKNKQIIEKQIEFFNPSIIIGGNIVGGIIQNQIEWGEELFSSKSYWVNIFQWRINGNDYPIVDMFHPSWRSLKNKGNLECERRELYMALEYVEEKYPGFWKKRCGNNCF